MSFRVGDRVVHSREGLSTITGETLIADNEYFIVRSDKGDKENIYVLKARTENIIRPVMNLEEAHQVIEYMKSVPAAFISNTKQRRDIYKKKLLSGDVKDHSDNDDDISDEEEDGEEEMGEEEQDGKNQVRQR